MATKRLSGILKRYKHIISEKSAIDDLQEMISCNHLIIAKSTFSWWGGYILSTIDKKAKIYCPEEFGFTTTESLFIEGWYKISS